ncbi:MAG TPA: putative metal-dependent hydrolase [Bacteroidota bacterium]|nr:putative metal-dependent hydrolase [Bacteroidota bacterium]
MNNSAMIDAIAALPDQIEAAVKGLNDAQLDTPYRQGGWTVRQVVHHLADSHMNAFIRMKLILTEMNPTLKPYNQDDWAVQSDVRGVPVASSLAILRGLHARWTMLLRAVPESGWGRKAIHPERGEITLQSMLQTYSGHGAKHVEHVLGLRRAKNW